MFGTGHSGIALVLLLDPQDLLEHLGRQVQQVTQELRDPQDQRGRVVDPQDLLDLQERLVLSGKQDPQDLKEFKDPLAHLEKTEQR